MTKVDIISGFLGAGKTTLIKKLLSESFQGIKVAVIENEFGEIGIDSGFLKDTGIEIKEMSSGCICCSLVGDFGEALKEVISTYNCDRVIIEPSGVGKLSDVIAAVEKNTDKSETVLASYSTVIDATKCRMYMKNFGEFYNNQVKFARTVILSRTDAMDSDAVGECVKLLREINPHANIITTPWDDLKGDNMLMIMESSGDSMEDFIGSAVKEAAEHEHHHHHHDHDHEEHEHHHHDHDHHHHDHDADEIFDSIGVETAAKYSRESLADVLNTLGSDPGYGIVLRAKGIVNTDEGWTEFDMVPGEVSIRDREADITGRFCVIGSELNEELIRQAFDGAEI